MKSIEDQFIDWESEAFGFGYGTGEPYIIEALKKFLLFCKQGSYNRQYDYEVLEKELTPTVAWLLINKLCREKMIEYGISPRYGWLTDSGEALREFMTTHTTDQIIDLLSYSENHTVCYRTACNCGPNGYQEGRVCKNVFWGTCSST